MTVKANFVKVGLIPTGLAATAENFIFPEGYYETNNEAIQSYLATRIPKLVQGEQSIDLYLLEQEAPLRLLLNVVSYCTLHGIGLVSYKLN